MSSASEAILEIRLYVSEELLGRLRSAFEDDAEYTEEEDLLTYTFMLGDKRRVLPGCVDSDL